MRRQTKNFLKGIAWIGLWMYTYYHWEATVPASHFFFLTLTITFVLGSMYIYQLMYQHRYHLVTLNGVHGSVLYPEPYQNIEHVGTVWILGGYYFLTPHHGNQALLFVPQGAEYTQIIESLVHIKGVAIPFSDSVHIPREIKEIAKKHRIPTEEIYLVFPYTGYDITTLTPEDSEKITRSAFESAQGHIELLKELLSSRKETLRGEIESISEASLSFEKPKSASDKIVQKALDKLQNKD